MIGRQGNGWTGPVNFGSRNRCNNSNIWKLRNWMVMVSFRFPGWARGLVGNLYSRFSVHALLTFVWIQFRQAWNNADWISLENRLMCKLVHILRLAVVVYRQYWLSCDWKIRFNSSSWIFQWDSWMFAKTDSMNKWIFKRLMLMKTNERISGEKHVELRIGIQSVILRWAVMLWCTLKFGTLNF